MTTAQAPSEDAATVLESFIADTSNLPAEIAHLLEEIQAKDQQLAEHRNVINNRDLQIQKFIKANGFGREKHPKEDAWVKQVQGEFERAARLQEEKVRLVLRAGFLVSLAAMLHHIPVAVDLCCNSLWTVAKIPSQGSKDSQGERAKRETRSLP